MTAVAGRLRLLHVITRLVLGGAQENTLLTLAHLDRDLFDITLASGPTQGPEGSLEADVPPDVRFVRIPDLVRDPSPVRDLRALRVLYRLMRDGRFDVVHTHTTKAGLLGRVAARLAGVPVVIHTPHGHAFHGYLSPLASGALVALERVLARWTDRIVCLTEAEREDYLSRGVGDPTRLAVVHSGVALERFTGPPRALSPLREALGIPEGCPVVGCVARLVPVKGVDVLLEAFAGVRSVVPHARLVVVGDGPDRAALEAQARTLHLDGCVTFAGLRRDVPDLMRLFDVVAVPSRNEGMGKVAVEAMAAGRPVVASAVSGLRDVVRDGQTGLLVPPGDPRALAAALTRLLADPALRARMGEAGRIRAADYAVARMVEALTSLYRNLAVAG
ncbi:MAG: glycosyltransferase family 4 protein [Armatimonadota bacterium]|nr:glycosyltransferase family 4 protein [Armatimonadota bacterium]